MLLTQFGPDAVTAGGGGGAADCVRDKCGGRGTKLRTKMESSILV